MTDRVSNDVSVAAAAAAAAAAAFWLSDAAKRQ